MKRAAVIPAPVPWPLSWQDVAYESIPKGEWMARVFWHSCEIIAAVEKRRLEARRLMRQAAGRGEVLELPVPEITVREANHEAYAIVAQEDELARHGYRRKVENEIFA